MEIDKELAHILLFKHVRCQNKSPNRYLDIKNALLQTVTCQFGDFAHWVILISALNILIYECLFFMITYQDFL